MAIAFVNTATASFGSAAASLALPATSLTTGDDIIIDVCLLDTTKSVSSITDTAGNTYTQLAAVNNGTGVRIEKWGKHNATGNAANIVTVSFSGNTACAIESTQFSGSTGFGNTGTATGTNAGPRAFATSQDANSWVQVGFAISGASTDTISALLGNLRGSKVDASAGSIPEIASADNTNGAGLCGIDSSVLLNVNTDKWAAAAVELRTGSTGSTYADYTGRLPVDGTPLATDERLINVKEPLAFSSASTPTPASGQLWPI
ncbi:MAG TPA: hypothetical protein VKW06_00685 [Candidatus Angelobacter sp.]|nr:hypothetical protein [Candidatus Angelobacter sp.]